MNAPTDFLGRAIKAGDTVVYPWRRGSQMGMRKLSITQVNGDSVVGYNNVGHRITIKNLQNVVVVQLPEPVSEAV